MERIAAILAIFVLLMNGRHVEARMPSVPRDFTVVAAPMPLDTKNPARDHLGPLRYLAGWTLTSRLDAFGGISSMHMTPDGMLVALNDTGEVAMFRPGAGARAARFLPLPAATADARSPKWKWDTESMTVDPATGTTWAGFELTPRICRYDARFTRVERCVEPPSMADWPVTTGMESLQRLPDGRFFAIAEQADGPLGPTDVQLFAGDPTDPHTPPPVRLAYHPPIGYVPTDALWLGGGRMLVMNRRVTLIDGFTGVLTLVDVGNPHAGQVLEGRVVARFTGSVQHDNLEALALSFEGGRPILWVASDDNHLVFERSLLFKFALPPAWVALKPPR